MAPLTSSIEADTGRRHPRTNGPVLARTRPNEARLDHAAAPIPIFSPRRGNNEARYIKLLSCLNSLSKYSIVLWLAKVKRVSPSATISLKDCPKSVFRQAFPVPVSFIGRFSTILQSLFGVPGDFNLGEYLFHVIKMC
jgi:hypothetical protein